MEVAAAMEILTEESDEVEIYSEPILCKEKAEELLALINLPKGLLPLKDLEEVGYNKTKGFVWLKMRNKIEHKFRAIGRKVSYDTEITAFVEDGRLRRLTGIKAKELMIWVPVHDIFINKQDPGKITFSNITGLSRTFKVSAFESED
ncbi:PREDICTED: uncharacterized protein LOC104820708 [Tarenaya hassleriana]|uniref:uncharacterized protein LOC104820708 n=1 Tax=Tarenaya hassleriana TaxID=28532 RepID=UPI0008FD8F63|nr:PREDICTED: uncharacterized protein LOC104820708 [Tarenaya hassleriana]